MRLCPSSIPSDRFADLLFVTEKRLNSWESESRQSANLSDGTAKCDQKKLVAKVIMPSKGATVKVSKYVIFPSIHFTIFSPMAIALDKN
jgi:hypothetical protein